MISNFDHVRGDSYQRRKKWLEITSLKSHELEAVTAKKLHAAGFVKDLKRYAIAYDNDSDYISLNGDDNNSEVKSISKNKRIKHTGKLARFDIF